MRDVPVTSISSDFGHIDDLLIDCELYIIELIKANGGEVEFLKYPYLLRRLQATQVVNMTNYLIFGSLSQKNRQILVDLSEKNAIWRPLWAWLN